MANTYKSIIITPNRSSNTADPNISFRGGNTSSNTTITMTVYPDSNGSLSFDGSAGQLFSITNDLSNSIFSVNDVSGIPSIEVFANGVVTLAPISGNIGLGNTTPAHKLRVEGTTSLNGAVNALSTLSVTGIATFNANANFDSGTLFVDSINNRVGVNNSTPTTALEVTGTITATTFSGSGASLTALNATALSTGTVPLARLSSASASANGVVDTTTQTFAGNKTFSGTVNATSTLGVTGTLTALGQLVVTTNAAFDTNVLFVDTVNNRVGVNNSGPTTALDVTGTATATTFAGSGASLTSLNATALSTGTVPVARLDSNVILTTSTTGINASALSTGTVPVARLSSANTTAAGVVDTTTQTFAGNKTFQNAATFSSTVSISGAANALSTLGVTGALTLSSALTANGGNGSAGQVLTSNGSGVYWATGSGGTTTSANTTANGLMDITTQTFAGNKTFQNAATFSSTLGVTGVATFSANANFDSGTLFVDGVNNRVGVNNSTPTTALEVTGTVTATTFSGSGASLTALNASALSTGTVPVGRLDSSVLLTTSTTGINASALSTGTVPIARLDSNVILTTSTTGINASALSTGTVPVARLSSANTTAAGIVDTTTQTFAGNKTFQNAATFSSTVGVTGALTLSSALTANSGNGTAGQVLTSNGSGVYWSTVSGGSASANTSGGTGGLQFYNGTTFGSDANLVFSSNRLTVNGTLTVTSNDVIFGSGDNTTNAVGITIRGPNANGLNLNGGNVIIAAGNGTGNAGTGAFIDFRTVPNAGSSGNTATTQNTAMRIAGQRVYVGARTDSYSPSNNGGLFIFLNAGGSAVEPAVAVDLDGSFGNVRTRLHSLVTSGAAYVGAQLGTQSAHPIRIVTNQGNYNISDQVRARLQFPSGGNMGVPSASLIYLDGVDCTGDTYFGETAANIIAFTANNAERFRLDGLGNAGLNSNTFGTNAAGVLAIRTTTEPTASVGNVVQFYTSTRTASNTIPALYCEGSGITNAGIANTTVTNKIAVKINGTIYYLLATTSAT